MAAARRRRLRKWIVVAVAAALLSIAGVVVVVLLVVFGDEPPPDDADLRVERTEVPEVENGFREVDLDGEELRRRFDMRSVSHPDGRWDLDRAAEMLAGAGDLLERLERSLEYPSFQVPAIEDVRDRERYQRYLGAWSLLRDLIDIRARLLSRDGETMRALDEIMKLLRFGHRIEGAGGRTIHYLIGSTSKMRGLRVLRAVVSESTADPCTLRSYGDRLAAFMPEPRHLKDALKLEYVLIAKAIDDVAAGRMPITELPEMETLENTEDWMAARPFLRPNATKRLLAYTFRTACENLDRLPSEWTEPPLELPEPGERINVAGRFYHDIATTDARTLGKQRAREEFDLLSTAVLLAVRCFHASTGRYPETLEELVPAHLDEVPRDPYDGEPLRYSREKALIWSVGEDLVDEGGALDDLDDGVAWIREPRLRLW